MQKRTSRINFSYLKNICSQCVLKVLFMRMNHPEIQVASCAPWGIYPVSPSLYNLFIPLLVLSPFHLFSISWSHPQSTAISHSYNSTMLLTSYLQILYNQEFWGISLKTAEDQQSWWDFYRVCISKLKIQALFKHLWCHQVDPKHWSFRVVAHLLVFGFAFVLFQIASLSYKDPCWC